MAENAPETALELIRARGITKSFSMDGTDIPVLSRLDLSVRQGESVAVVGASGIGKSTLLHILGCLERPDKGELFYGEEEVFRLSDDNLADFRNRSVGFVFQFHHLLPEFTARENTAIPLMIAGRERRWALDQAAEMLDGVGLSQRLNHRVGELSGGEQQRVALARALACGPSVLLADEPTGNLDVKTGERIHELLRRMNREQGMTMVVVTHNPSLAAMMGRRVTLSEGGIRELD